MNAEQKSLLEDPEPLTPQEMMPASVLPPERALSQPTPLEILQVAVERGRGADELEKLLTLQERYEANQARRAFSEAMHAAQQEMPRVIRDAENTQTKSKYARLEDVQNTAGPVYTKHGFSLSYGEGETPTEGYKRTICDVRHSAGHVEQYHLDLPIDGIGPRGNAIGGMNKVQGCISTTSYGQRRLLCMIFNITIAGEDNDGQFGPTPHDTPAADPNAPAAAPRGERDTIDANQFAWLTEHWEKAYGVTENKRDAWQQWFKETTGNTFPGGQKTTLADYKTCCAALGVPE